MPRKSEPNERECATKAFLGDWAWGHPALCPSRKVQEREGVSEPAGEINSLDSVDEL